MKEDIPSTIDQLLISLRRIIRAVDLHSKKLVQTFGLTGPQLVVLSELEKMGQASISELAKNIHLSHTTVADILFRLEKHTLVAREKNEKDKRKVSVTLTDKGRDVIAKKPSLLHEKLTEEFMGLEQWERTMLLSSLQRVVSMMEMEKETADSTTILVSGPLGPSPETQMGYLTHGAVVAEEEQAQKRKVNPK